MKLFLDTADRELIKKWVPTGLVDGITTNPTHLSKQGPNSKQVLLDICSMVEGDVSIEVVEKKPEAVAAQAREIANLAQNVVVKIPFSPEYLPVIKQLSQENIKINVTLVFNTLQALMVAKLGVAYISPFAGRLDDIGADGIATIADIVAIKEIYDLKSEILAASIRSVQHWHQSALAGADVATLPPTVFEQAMHHPLTEKGIALFDRDWQKLGKEKLLG
ncbi:MAG: fructose-6-phosphate aldolase [Epsilonproteobacteria bacterium]|nr:fructose-6-phosphate aldolase [Campylobacterota bacterium]